MLPLGKQREGVAKHLDRELHMTTPPTIPADGTPPSSSRETGKEVGSCTGTHRRTRRWVLSPGSLGRPCFPWRWLAAISGSQLRLDDTAQSHPVQGGLFGLPFTEPVELAYVEQPGSETPKIKPPRAKARRKVAKKISAQGDFFPPPPISAEELLHQPAHIKGYRIEAKTTQAELGDAVGVSGRTISNYERSHSKLSQDNATRIAQVLNWRRGIMIRDEAVAPITICYSDIG